MEPKNPSDKKFAEAWYTCVRAARPFNEVRVIPAELRVPLWFGFSLAAVTVAGAVMGWVSGNGAVGSPERFTNGAFFSSLYAFVAVSLLDIWEHFRLEKHVSGRYCHWTVIPTGESIIHMLIGAVLVVIIALARPMQTPLEERDWLVLIGPLLFLSLGWCDELIYHRRRALHREDILHTLSHLAAGAMLVSLFAARVISWT